MGDKIKLAPILIERYASGSSIPEIAKMDEANGASLSTIRQRLKDAGVLRSRADAIRQAFAYGKIRRKGVKRPPFTEDHRRAISAAMLKYSDKHAAGKSCKTNSYVEFTRGENKGRGEHRVKMEKRLGRALLSTELVHHDDEQKHNNQDENLSVMSRAEHSRHHAIKRLPKMKRGKDGRWVKVSIA